MAHQEPQSFFMPEAYSSHEDLILSHTYNLAQRLLKRSGSDHLFVSIRSLQYLAIIEADAFWFVDSMAYAVQDNEGGRLITVSWHPQLSPSQREGLAQHMTCTVTYYGEDRSEIQTRLRSELLQAMALMDRRERDALPGNHKARILPFSPRSNRD